MNHIAYDRYSMIIDGRRVFVRSGAMHYFRLPSRALWRDRLYKLKAAGYNTVDLYFCWDYHSPAPGVYDFSGIRDVRALLDITRELGLMVIARPGPYINAEYSGGGFPGWLLAKRDLPLRCRREGAFVWSDEYVNHVREWWGQIVPIINEYDHILMMQVENEYATLEMEPDYMQALYQMARDLGARVPLFHNDLYVSGLYADIVDIYSFDNYSVTQFETDWREMPEIFQVIDNIETNLRPFCENRPLMAAELQAGWYGSWKGYRYETITEYLGREHISISTKSVLGQGLTIFNHYKAIGGTNWNYTGSTETYTSYDFGAPISEAGVNTERLFESKAINWWLSSFDFTATDRRTDGWPFHLSDPSALYAVRSPVDQPYAYWLFLRNLTYDIKHLTLDQRFDIEVNPFEVLILPYQIPLASGYRLDVATVETLYQNDRCLYLKGNRAMRAVITAPDGQSLDVDIEGHAAGVEVQEHGENRVVFRCHELAPDEYRRLRIGTLTVFLLGQDLVDRFWVEEDGTVVFGPDERLPGGIYGMAAGRTQAHTVDPMGAVRSFSITDHSGSLQIPELIHWDRFNEAPELFDPDRVGSDFEPVASEPDFDTNGLYEGSAWYRLPLSEKPDTVTVDARHIWAVFLNDRLIGHGHQLVLIHGLEPPPPTELSVPPDAWREDGPNTLNVFVSGLGHPKGFHDDAQTPQGLLTLQVDGRDVSGQVAMAKSLFFRRPLRAGDNEALMPLTQPSPLVRIKTEFILPANERLDSPWGLCLKDMDVERINLYLNGLLIGRAWRECQRQDVFYLPTGLLQEAGQVNTLELVLMNFEPYLDEGRLERLIRAVSLKPYSVFTKWERGDTLKV